MTPNDITNNINQFFLLKMEMEIKAKNNRNKKVSKITELE